MQAPFQSVELDRLRRLDTGRAATAVQAVDRFFRVCLVEDACAAFDPSWHAKAVDLINEPQVRKGHADQPVGLYFGEVSSSQDVVRGLRDM